MKMMWGDHWMFGRLMWLFWVIVLGALIFLVWWIVRKSQASASRHEEDAMDILKKRYARAKIDKEKFEQKKKDIHIQG
jgi:uncharacterized membrane protein